MKVVEKRQLTEGCTLSRAAQVRLELTTINCDNKGEEEQMGSGKWREAAGAGRTGGVAGKTFDEKERGARVGKGTRSRKRREIGESSSTVDAKSRARERPSRGETKDEQNKRIQRRNHDDNNEMARASVHNGGVGRYGEGDLEHGVQNSCGHRAGDTKDGHRVGDGENKGGEDGVDGKESEEGVGRNGGKGGGTRVEGGQPVDVDAMVPENVAGVARGEQG